MLVAASTRQKTPLDGIFNWVMAKKKKAYPVHDKRTDGAIASDMLTHTVHETDGFYQNKQSKAPILSAHNDPRT